MTFNANAAQTGLACSAAPTAASTDRSATSAGSKPSLAALAAAANPDRNRAVDLFRAVAMLAVALGHWAAIMVAVDNNGDLVSGNALEAAPSLAIMSWLFQVMPLFFVVGGFSSAMSLDAHTRKDGLAQDWIAGRLRRMLAPTAVLAFAWFALLIIGALAGVGSFVAVGAAAAAIPLWFLSNYTVDTAIAPYLLPRFRRNPALVAGGGVAVFLLLEAIRFAGVPFLPQINWILGWLLFQTAGFAWRDGILPTGPGLMGVAAVLWTMAIAAVTIGPYPVSMVHFPGIGDLSPSHPPSLALMLFGGAYSATALLIAPAASAWLAKPTARSRKAWAAVVAGNSMAMTVYLWHFTAAVAAGAVLYTFGALPTAEVGTVAWWIQKLPLIALSTIILGGIVALVGRFERGALLAARAPWNGSPASMIGLAAVVSVAIKVWTSGNSFAIAAAAATVLIAYHIVLNPKRALA